jgi:hypothetical protein
VADDGAVDDESGHLDRRGTLIHVTVPPSSKPPSTPGVRWHDCDVPACDVRRGTTTVLRTVLDRAATLPFAEVCVVLDPAWVADTVLEICLARDAA